MTSDEKLIKAYEKTKKELDKKLKSAKAGTAKSYYRKLIKEIEESIKELQRSAAAYVNTAVPKDYMENAADIFEQLRQQGVIMKPPEAFRQLHTDAIYDLRREVMTQIEQGIAKAKQQTENLIAEAHEIAQKAALRSIGLDAAQHKIDTVGTVTDMQQEVVKKLEETGILKVEVGSGEHKREMSITNYAHLVARSTSREVGNTARINQMSANGFDLVEIPPHYPTCEICAILQDRVYSISGEDKRFPPLSKAIGEYKNIHPHCRHVIVGWAEMMYTPKEIEETIKKSNRPWTDPRSGEEKQFYNELQKKNRQARDLQYQYERYKKRLGSDAPKSLYAFKRIKKDEEKFKKLKLDYTRRGKLVENPELLLPFADNAFIAEEKFTKYFFNPENPKGWEKGLAFSSHLGYNIKNWEAFQTEILEKVKLNPSVFDRETKHGKYYNIPMVLYGKTNNPMNINTAWEIGEDEKPRFVTAFPD